MTGESIRKKSFMTVKSGYDIDAVEDYLSDVSKAFDEVIAKNEETEGKLVKLAEELQRYKEDEEAIKNALVISQKESAKIISDAKAQARDMIESAKTEQVRLSEQSASECERIIREHKENCARLIKENTEVTEKKIAEIRANYESEKAAYEELKKEVTLFKAQLLALYQQQLPLIMEIPEAPIEEEEEEVPVEEAVEEEAEEVVEEVVEEAVDPEKEHIDKILNTGSFEPVIPKENLQDLRFGKNN